MSTGFSGNLGFSMPKNWSFSQFYETSIGEGSGYLEIDKNDSSERDIGASHFEQLSPPDPYDKIIKDVLSNVGNGIPIFSGLSGKIVLDGEERELLNTNLLRVTHSSSKEVTQGDENDTANIVYAIDGQPADNPFYASILGRIQGVGGISNKVQVGSKGMVNTLASNIGNGQIKTSISAEFGQIVYTYEVVVTDIELPFATSVAASIILKVYLKNHNFPPGSPVPVAVTEKINEVSTEAFNGKDVATEIVTGLAIIGLGLFAVYATPVAAATLTSLASSFTAATAALLGT
jgi:peptidoglycan hydrolase-like protein with peptidoglycan-binding domain